MKRFENQVAIVTGAGRGIGLDTARHFAREGAAVAIFDLDAASAEAGAKAIVAEGGRAIGLGVDVTDEFAVENGFAATVEAFGSVSILVNNAGIYPHIPLEDVSYDAWRKIIAVNLDSAFLCCRAAFPIMKKAGYGRIVNLSSTVFFTGLVKVSAYAASKGGVTGFTRVIASEGGPFGITANSVAPGLIETEGVMEAISEHFDAVLAGQAIKRRGQPKDITDTIAFLASPDAGFITGQMIVPNGGITYY